MSAQGERALVDGRRERVVDDDRRAHGVAGSGEARDVDHLERGIGRRLQVEHRTTLGDRGLDLLVIGGVAEFDPDAEPGQEVEEDAVGAAVRVLHRDHPVAGREQTEEDAAHGRHTGGEAGRRVGLLELPDLLLEGVDRRVRVAAVDVPGSAPVGDVQPRVHVRIPVRRAVDHRHLGRALDERLLLTGPDRLGVEREGAGLRPGWRDVTLVPCVLAHAAAPPRQSVGRRTPGGRRPTTKDTVETARRPA